jgi:hypothetical protein
MGCIFGKYSPWSFMVDMWLDHDCLPGKPYFIYTLLLVAVIKLNV